MFSKLVLAISLSSALLWGFTIQKGFSGNWHIRIIDGNDVREARAILELDMRKMRLSGFDACNRIYGNIVKLGSDQIAVPTFSTTHMACRESIHMWVRTRLQETLKEGFVIQQGTSKDTKGIIIKSAKHTLFLKKMGDENIISSTVQKVKKIFK